MARPVTHSPRPLDGPELGPASGAALTAIVRAHSQYVFRVLRCMGVREGDVDDLCQETFLVVHRKLPTYEPRAALRSWIYAIALRVVSDYRDRAHRKREMLVDEPPERIATAQPSEALERRQDWALLDRLTAELSEEQRQVFVLFEVEELEMREICQIVGCPLQTAYSRLHAARKRIADKLARLRAEGAL
jgi:RNA polymerase sigma-70 factor (ECF subfamily)